MKKIFLLTALLTLAVLTLPRFSAADLYIKQEITEEGMAAKAEAAVPAQRVQEVWVTPAGYRADSDKESMLLNFEEEKIISLDHAAKTYTQMPMNTGKMMAEAMGAESEDAEGAAAMGMMMGMMKGMMKMTAAVTPTGEKKKIGDWNCEKYNVKIKTMMGQTTEEIWASEDIRVNERLAERLRTATFAMMPGVSESLAQFTEEMKKVKGVAVETISTSKVMNKTVTTTTRLLEYKEGDAPKDMLAPPADYKLVNEN